MGEKDRWKRERERERERERAQNLSMLITHERFALFQSLSVSLFKCHVMLTKQIMCVVLYLASPKRAIWVGRCIHVELQSYFPWNSSAVKNNTVLILVPEDTLPLCCAVAEAHGRLAEVSFRFIPSFKALLQLLFNHNGWICTTELVSDQAGTGKYF